MLYPLKFKPIYKKRIWGGKQLRNMLHKTGAPDACGESWEISAVEGSVSIVSNGYLAGNNLTELVEIYMGDLVGDKVYEVFGDNFPLLIKWIDAADDLSYQVHPDDEYAFARHQAPGKNELWYIMHCDEGASLVSGFKSTITREEFLNNLKLGLLPEIVNHVSVSQGDVVHIPSGRIHSIGKGIVLAEIQQSSDITYRVWDFDRPDKDGKLRELHLEDALNVLDYSKLSHPLTPCNKKPDCATPVIETNYFSCNMVTVLNILERDYGIINSFVILICVTGAVHLNCIGENYPLQRGETILIPAEIKEITMEADGYAEILEVYINTDLL
ncbi:MAG: class I mannose-6-phosphate isomerase [Bacteroidales bacterium]|nr:class I mannose-6-phosphate isomerase [Bacteroidales bacterium]